MIGQSSLPPPGVGVKQPHFIESIAANHYKDDLKISILKYFPVSSKEAKNNYNHFSGKSERLLISFNGYYIISFVTVLPKISSF